MPPTTQRNTKNSKFRSNHSSSGANPNKLVVNREDSIYSERRRDIKHTKKASYFTKAQKIQEGVLSDDNSLGSMELHTSKNNYIDPIEDLNLFSEEAKQFDDNFVLDTTQELPIRKPQSAYVIFGKLVSQKLNMSFTQI
jgi:flagellar basal body P-ring protein FlgI